MLSCLGFYLLLGLAVNLIIRDIKIEQIAWFDSHPLIKKILFVGSKSQIIVTYTLLILLLVIFIFSMYFGINLIKYYSPK